MTTPNPQPLTAEDFLTSRTQNLWYGYHDHSVRPPLFIVLKDVQAYGDYREAEVIATRQEEQWRPIDASAKTGSLYWLEFADGTRLLGGWDSKFSFDGVTFGTWALFDGVGGAWVHLKDSAPVAYLSLEPVPPTTMKENNHDHP